jgi:hypothetical protein
MSSPQANGDEGDKKNGTEPGHSKGMVRELIDLDSSDFDNFAAVDCVRPPGTGSTVGKEVSLRFWRQHDQTRQQTLERSSQDRKMTVPLMMV